MIKRILVFFALLLSAKAIAEEPISVSELIKENKHISASLNPAGNKVLSFDIVDDQQIFSLIDPIEEELTLLLKVDDLPQFKVKEYHWIDNQYLYIELKNQQGILKINYQDDSVKGVWHPVSANGYLVGVNPKNNKILFAHTDKYQKPRTQLHFLTPQQLIDGDLNDSTRHPVELAKAERYFYDNSMDTLLAVRKKDRKFDVVFLDKDQNLWRSFLTLNDEIDFKIIGFINKDTLAVLSNANTDVVSLIEFDIKTKQYGDILYQHPIYDLTNASVSINNGIESVTYIESSTPKIEYLTTSTGKIQLQLTKAFNGASPFIIDASDDNQSLLIGIFSSDNPGGLYHYDVNTATAKQVIHTQEFADGTKFAKSKTYQVNTEDGDTIEAILTLPQSNDNGVLLVYPHGGPIGVRDYSIFNRETQYFTSRGYAVLNVNFRGSAGFGRKFLEKGRAQFGKLIEKDITTALTHIEKSHSFKNICAIGASYGGYSAMMLAIKQPQKYDCVVSMYGIYDLPHLFNSDNYLLDSEYRRDIEYVIGEQRAELIEVSPFYLADKLNTPTLILAGEKDDTAPFEQSNRMKYRLQQLGKDFEYLFYEGVAHGHKSLKGNRHELVFVDNFIRDTLKLPRNPTKKYNSAFAEDVALIAEGYKFDDTVRDSPRLATMYLRKAANLGHARSMHNLGWHLGYDKSIDNNIPRAIY